MRTIVLIMLLLTGGAVPALGQTPLPWTAEIGLRSSFARTDVDGTSRTTLQFPAGEGYQGSGTGTALYAVLPLNARLAIEPSFGYSDADQPTNMVGMAAGARILLSVWRGLYVGAGPTMVLIKSDGKEEGRFGAVVAAGYRFPIGGVVTARTEFYYQTLSEGKVFDDPSSSTVGLALGLGMGLGAPASSVRPSDALWELALGIQGGYTHFTDPGAIDGSSVDLPGAGSAFGQAGLPVPSVSPWFVVIPVGKHFALEPSFSYSSYTVEDGGGSGSSYGIGLKGNYAFNRTVYAGLSAEYAGMGGEDWEGTDGSTGIGAQTGFRFPLVGGVKGRFEVNYRTYSSGENNILGVYHAYSFAFGMTAPLR